MDNSEIANNQPTETTETQQASTPKSSNKWLKIGLLGVFGLALAGGLVFAGYKLGQKEEQTKFPQPTPASFPTVTSAPTLMPEASPTTVVTPPSDLTPTLDPTADWKTIQMGTNIDPQKNLEIKYPPNWFYLSGKELGGTGAGDLITSFYTNKIEENLSEEKIQIQIFILLPPEEGLDNFALNYEKSGLISPVKIKINNFEGYEGKTDTGIKYLLKMDENNIAHIYVSPKNSKLIEIFDQILSTFNFLD